MKMTILACQYPDISHLLGPSYVLCLYFVLGNERVKKSIKYVQKMGHLKSQSAIVNTQIYHIYLALTRCLLSLFVTVQRSQVDFLLKKPKKGPF